MGGAIQVTRDPKKGSFPQLSAIDADWGDAEESPTDAAPKALDRPTVAPPPGTTQALAEASATAELPTPPPPPRAARGPIATPPAARAPMPTLSDESVVEEARQLSLRSDRPNPALSDATLRRSSLLALANQASDLDVAQGALDLVEERVDDAPGAAPTLEVAEPSAYDPVAEMQDRFSLGDYSGSLVVAESLLSDDPEHAEAKKYAENCRSILEQMYTARLGALDRVPYVAVPLEQLRWLSIDHRAGFVLSHVDGTSTLEQILDIASMPLLDTLRILYELVQHRVIAFR